MGSHGPRVHSLPSSPCSPSTRWPPAHRQSPAPAPAPPGGCPPHSSVHLVLAPWATRTSTAKKHATHSYDSLGKSCRSIRRWSLDARLTRHPIQKATGGWSANFDIARKYPNQSIVTARTMSSQIGRAWLPKRTRALGRRGCNVRDAQKCDRRFVSGPARSSLSSSVVRVARSLLRVYYSTFSGCVVNHHHHGIEMSKPDPRPLLYGQPGSTEGRGLCASNASTTATTKPHRTGSFIGFHQPSFGPWPAWAASPGASWLSASCQGTSESGQ